MPFLRTTVEGGILLILAFTASVSAKVVITEHKASLRSKVDSAAFQRNLRTAMSEVLGCGGDVDQAELRDIEQVLTPIWRALPKSTNGRIDRRSLRYLGHRHFYQRFALQIRGFEPSRAVNESSWGNADVLSTGVPSYIESYLASQHVDGTGFDLHDAVYMVAMIQRLMFDAETSLLQRVYEEQQKQVQVALSRLELEQLLQAYMVHWMMGDDTEGIRILLGNKTLLATSFPHWSQIVALTSGQIKALEFWRQRSVSKATAYQKGLGNALSTYFSFDDAHHIVGGITKSFASFWESECASMKELLISMDTHKTGRVALGKFYGTGLDAEWRFGESESYLRELGALDESSSWRGKEVIIPNYIQAASNCIVSSPHYMVCCINQCDERLSEIEIAIGAPLALPEDISSLIGNMSDQSSLDDDAALKLSVTLRAQLQDIAVTHGGRVPLHGRLFGQWLHYVFPRECPFPHKVGVASRATPLQYGQDFLASEEEMKMHAFATNGSDGAVFDKDDHQWMSQWSSDEELILDYAGSLRAPWERSRSHVMLFVLFGLGSVVAGWSRMQNKHDLHLLPTHSKAHFV